MFEMDYSQQLDRIDKLAMLYLEKACDISSMTVEEYIKKFNEISKELRNLIGETIAFDTFESNCCAS